MTDRVWAVSTGIYSAYRVLRIFLTEEEANRYAQCRNTSEGGYDQCEVEGFPLGWPPSDGEEWEGSGWKGDWYYTSEQEDISHTRHDGTMWRPQPRVKESSSVTQAWLIGSDNNVKARVTHRCDDPERYHDRQYGRVIVIGTSKEHVEKTLHDEVAAAKAQLVRII